MRRYIISDTARGGEERLREQRRPSSHVSALALTREFDGVKSEKRRISRCYSQGFPDCCSGSPMTLFPLDAASRNFVRRCPLRSAGFRDGEPFPAVLDQRDCECGEKVPHHAVAATSHIQSGGVGEERSIVCFQFVLSHSSPLFSLCSCSSSSREYIISAFARPQTPLISFQDRSMTFCYAPQVQAEPSVRPRVGPSSFSSSEQRWFLRTDCH